MVNVKSIKPEEWYDTRAEKYRKLNDVWEVSEARAEQLINAGYAAKDEPTPEYNSYPKKSRGVNAWESKTDQ